MPPKENCAHLAIIKTAIHLKKPNVEFFRVGNVNFDYFKKCIYNFLDIQTRLGNKFR